MLQVGGRALQSHGGMISKPMSGESWELVGKGIRKRKTISVGVKNLIGHHLELRSRPRSWGRGQTTQDHVGTLE